jgi:hypothetical protein
MTMREKPFDYEVRWSQMRRKATLRRQPRRVRPSVVLYDGRSAAIGALPVLGNLFEVAGQHLDRFVDLGLLVSVQGGKRRCGLFLQLIQQFNRQPGEAVGSSNFADEFDIEQARGGK